MRNTMLYPLAALAVAAGCASGPQNSDSRAAAPVTRSKAHAEEPSPAVIQRAVDAVYPALVRIHVVAEVGADGRMQKFRASGSGTIISEDGYIVTNHHVSGRATRIVCRLSNREEVDAVLVGTDPLSDISVLKLDLSSRRDPKAPLPVARFGNSDLLKVGDVVLAMGSPAGLSQSVTKGIVANTSMIAPGGAESGFVLDGEKVGELVRWIGHDAVIYFGNSGGPMVNLKGEIVGVNEVGIGSLGGAIPGNLAQSVARSIIANGRVPRSWIGLEVQPLLKKQAATKGILAATILDDGPAEKAGLKPGDIITNYHGTVIEASRAPEDLPVFNRLVLNTPVGATVTIGGLRGDQPMEWRLTTEDRELNKLKEGELKAWGLAVRNFSRMAALEQYRTNRAGVLVDSVRSGGPSAEAKPELRANDVVIKVADRPIANAEALRQFTEEFTAGGKEPKPVVVEFERGLQRMLTVVKVGPEVPEEKPARPPKAFLGVATQVLMRELADALGLDGHKGVRITQVMPDAPAAKADIRAGDIFFKMDGQVIDASTLNDLDLFDNLIRLHKVGDTVELEGLRDGRPLKLTAVLGKRPKPTGDLDEYKDEWFEFTARELAQSERVEARLSAAQQGVSISAVQAASWAELAGLKQRDILLAVEGQPVGDITRLKEIMTQLRDRKPRFVEFQVQRGIRMQFVEIEPKW